MPIYRLPPYRVEALFMAEDLNEQIDWGLQAYDVPSHWKDTKGEGVKLVILDTGAETTHPDLVGAIKDARDFSNSRSGPTDMNGHGTHTLGLILAQHNGIGVMGIAPKVEAYVGKVLGDDGSGSDANIIAGLAWAVSIGADVVSMSLGSPSPDPNLLRAIQAAHDAGIKIICAAGNDGRPNSVNYPGKWKQTISVASVDQNGMVSRFSSQGPEVDIAAPGENILSCYKGGGYAKLSGTSMATPFVAGVTILALAAQKAGKLKGAPLGTTEDLRILLKDTAKDAGPQGHDPGYGWGLITPDSMLTITDIVQPGQPGAPQADPLIISNVKCNGVDGELVFRPLTK